MILNEDSNIKEGLSMNINKDTKLGEIIEKLDKKKQNSEFDDLYNGYKDAVEDYSGGLVLTNKSDFLKMYAFFATVS